MTCYNMIEYDIICLLTSTVPSDRVCWWFEGLQSTPRVQLSLGLDWNFAVPKSPKALDFEVGCDWCWFWLSQEHGFRLSTGSFSVFFFCFLKMKQDQKPLPKFYLFEDPPGRSATQETNKLNMKHVKP